MVQLLKFLPIVVGLFLPFICSEPTQETYSQNTSFVSSSESETIVESYSWTETQEESSESSSSSAYGYASANSSSSSNIITVSNGDYANNGSNCNNNTEQICGLNEVFDACPVLCPPKECGVDGAVYDCPAPPNLGDANCNPGCRCIDGYKKNCNNVCVTEEDCQKCNGPHEYYACAGACDNVCKTLKDQNQTNCPIVNKKCNEMCYCEEGYARNDNNTCVPFDQCPGICEVNEEFRCRYKCSEISCNDIDKTSACPINNESCIYQCYCKPGYYRNDDGQCVTKKQCPPPITCGLNEEYSSCANGGCGKFNCSRKDQPDICIRPIKCERGCRCKDTYLRTASGACVPADQCPLTCPRPNEVVGCANTCPPEKCEDADKIFFCPRQSKICLSSCRCKPGFYRNKLNECISKEDCLKCTGPYEYYSCGGACDNVCETLTEQNQTNCPIVNIKCNEMCYCEEGYARNDNNTCVPFDQCPVKCSGKNEEYRCKYSCSEKSCKDVNKTSICPINNENCTYQCYCKPGYYRNNDGQCVTKKQCQKCGVNEVFDICPAKCPPRRCGVNPAVILCLPNPQPGDPECDPSCRCIDGYLKNDKDVCVPKEQCPKCSEDNEEYRCDYPCSEYSCANIDKVSVCPIKDKNCTYQCYCKPGFYRNDDGKCVTIEKCLKCDGPHEYYACGGACDNVCKTLKKQNQTNCPIINIRCNDMCYCEDGYARDDNNICVPFDKCPGKCGLNEVFDVCPAPCPPKICGVDETLLDCIPPPKPGDPACNPGCRCIDGYYKDYNNVCVPKDKCPKCKGENEEYRCRFSCSEKSCNDVNKTSICPITKENCTYQCYCKPGFYRNDDGQCVTEEQCPPPITCGFNEEYSSCANGGCGKFNCSRKDLPDICIRPLKCERGCRCKDTYLRTASGLCVPTIQCPLTCSRPNEVVGCASTCPSQICENIDKIFHCPLQPAVCRPDCRCKPGFYRNKIKECISKENCLKCNGPHEYYSCGGACDNVCKTLKKQNQTNCPIINVKCNEMCYCEKGYARNDNNTCVPFDQCPGKCGLNEVFDECPATCPPRRCGVNEAVIKCAAPPKPGDPNCRPGCRCIDGYYKDYDNVCIPKDQCPKCSGKNEEYRCKYSCSDKSCNDVNKTSICPIKKENCTYQCYCKPGFYRNDDGQCVTKEQCPPPIICGDNEEYTTCVNGGCGKFNCSRKDQPIICIRPIKCERGCRCKDTYLRTATGKCVPEDQCPPKCGINEIFDDCPAKCPPRRCGVNEALIRCAAPPKPGSPDCEPGCRCIDGYYKNYDNVCIPKEQCLKCDGPHEYYSCGGACDNVCETLKEQNQTNCPIINIKCNEMCYCDEGYARDDNNICVPFDQCPAKCSGRNEEYRCRYSCSEKSCDDVNKTSICPTSNESCIYQCYCKPGFYRDDDDQCVTKEQCRPPIICGPDEDYTSCVNGGCGKWNCSQVDQPDICIDPIRCKPGCRCKKPLLRTASGKCVPRDQCPRKCGLNEVFDVCPVTCPPRKCGMNKALIKCAPPPKPGGPNCRPGCRCIDGYYKDYNNICIPKEQCPKCRDKNEEYLCNSCPEKTCDDIDKITLCLIENKNCVNKCYCKTGFYRNDDGQCVTEEQCRPPIICGPDEVYTDCVNGGCGKWNCTQLYEPDLCIDPYKCKPGCFCKETWLRTASGKCVPRDQCPENKCKENEEYVECQDSVCRPKTCSEVGFPLSCYLNASQSNCTKGPGCICAAGYVKNEKGQCISESDCPACGGDPNARPGSGTFCKTCNNYNETFIACPFIYKLNSCDCKEGYVYETTLKVCVLPEQCRKCTKPNEVIGCKSSCPPQSCKSIGRQYKCIPPPKVCTPDCRCKPGFYRNEITNECISEKNCLKCNGPHEYYACGGACDNVCKTLHIQNQTRCPIINIKCNDKCYCEKGYARDDNNICVPFNECPEKQCKENEEYVNCQDSVCRPKTCSEVGFPLSCYLNASQSNCTKGPGCICKAGYVKNEKGQCISETECPSCGGDPNARPGSGVFCKTCNNYNKKNILCPLIIKQNGCDCKEGYVYETTLKICVLPEQCHKCTKPNEVIACKRSCPPQTCESIGRKYKCVPPPKVCTPDCRCKPGFYRSKITNQCISEKNCQKCKGPHEYYSCSGACDNVCKNLDVQNQTSCPIKNKRCNDRCYCEKGYARNDNNTCVPISECPPKKCGKNAVYVTNRDCSCGPSTCSELGFPMPCLLNNTFSNNCTRGPGCVCNAGYIKNNKGECIPKEQCPSCGGDKNAQSGCGINCGKKCHYNGTNPKFCPRICLYNACDCRKDYVYDSNLKKCVRINDCTPECGINEVFSNCSNGGCRRNTCAEISLPYVCRDLPKGGCKTGCLCKPGYLRDDNNTCIPSDQCPNRRCDKNEVYVECPDILCRPLNCTDVGRSLDCPEIDAVSCPSEPSCVCDEGYARSSNGTCVPTEECPKNCGKNAVYVENRPCSCRAEKCSELGYPLPCDFQGVPIDNCTRGPGCVCDAGYIKNDDGDCVPTEECPSCGGDENAEAGCGYNCGRKCSNYRAKFKICPRIACWPDKCDCRQGYVYDDNIGRCVLPDDCTPVCGLNEEFSNCSNGGCQKNTCAELNSPDVCRDISEGGCEPGCLCKSGYLRDKNNTCIPADQCPETSKCGKNEVYVKSRNCTCRAKSCSELGFPLECLQGTRSLNCTEGPGCFCQNGFIKSDDGKCIPPEECPSCGGDPNARTGCGGNCGRKCSTYRLKNEVCILSCRLNGCDCKKDYVYDSNIRRCVLPEDCTPVCGSHEVFSNCSNGGCQKKTCAELGYLSVCRDLPKSGCKPGCLCEPGYLRADNNTCIPSDQCPTEKKCGKNEVYVEKQDCSCIQRKCSELGYPLPCQAKGTPRDNCTEEPGCVCQAGYVKNDKGDCIPRNECPSCGGDKNAQAGCGFKCKTCSNYRAKINFCPRIACVPNKCDCRPGYVYDNNLKTCVLPENCTPVCGLNEEYSNCSNGGCQKNTCAELGSPDVCRDLSEDDCEPGCLCKSGYLRDENNTCILSDQCPQPPKCGKNAEYIESRNCKCRAKKCSELGFSLECFQNTPTYNCTEGPGCFCIDGYVENENGECIPEKECPSCGGDVNAEAGCGVHCGNKCSDYRSKYKVCPAICRINGCECKKSYVYDDNLKSCVLPQYCTQECGRNELYSQCSNDRCQKHTCAELALSYECGDFDEDSCKPGCICKCGYLRAENYTCIPFDQCPKNDSQNDCTENVKETELLIGNDNFNSVFLYDSAKSNPGKSIIISAFSVLFVLAQLALYATGAALQQLLALLNLYSKSEIRCTVPPLLTSILRETNITFDVAQKIYGNERIPFSKQFEDDTADIFFAKAENINVNNPTQAAKIINDWAASKTNNMIQNLIPPTAITPNTVLVIVNAINFEGTWKKEFDPKLTKPKNFYVSNDKNVTVQMMNQLGFFRYGVTPSSKSQVIELPYVNSNFTFVAILPPNKFGINDLLEELKNTTIQSIVNDLQQTKVDLYLPQFKIETSTDLKTPLNKANVTEIFKFNSGLQGITQNPYDLAVTAALQKAIVIVNEKGTKAAAATAVIVTFTSSVMNPPTTVVFNANHCFVYYILYRRTPTFGGIYAGPQ